MVHGLGRALAPKERALRGRRLVVVDVENVVGGAVLRSEDAIGARRAVEDEGSLRDGEQVVLGVSHVGVLAMGMAWRGPRIVMRSGPDGADRALLEVLEGERVDARFDELLLVSGDGIFANVVGALGARGVTVTVLAHPDRCATRLRLAAAKTIYFKQPTTAIGGAA